MNGAGSIQPLVPVTDTDHAGYIIFAIYGGLFTTAVFWIIRLVFRFQKLNARLDDVFLILAMFFAVLQTICVQISTSAGLGSVREATDDGSEWEKRFFAAQILNLLSQTCSKLSVNLLFQSFQPFQGFSIANRASLALHIAWAVSTIVALGLQCGPPNPWRLGESRCINLHSLNLGIDLTNILSEACLILIPAAMMPRVQTNWNTRLLVIVCFACRLAVIAVLAGHITTLHHFTAFTDPSWSYTTPAIWNTIVMNVSLLTAAVPGMQQFLADLRPGMTTLQIRDAHRDGSGSASVFGAYSRARATAYSDGRGTGKGGTWELSNVTRSKREMGRLERSRREESDDAESVQGLTRGGNNIVVTREFDSYIEDGARGSQEG
ncbi:hypothetical protein LTR62_008193 [Meristemomyces frigidus]|uniref:Rhodopsin domain-containing protein n=1 Tax=Meristemomyces frigidus TaxID=1508187 RepID=A0AAN7TBA8_9PEZI|nr:hypothetical protein LTR62_008193 [Meristemomyces frigidus]